MARLAARLKACPDEKLEFFTQTLKVCPDEKLGFHKGSEGLRDLRAAET